MASRVSAILQDPATPKIVLTGTGPNGAMSVLVLVATASAPAPAITVLPHTVASRVLGILKDPVTPKIVQVQTTVFVCRLHITRAYLVFCPGRRPTAHPTVRPSPRPTARPRSGLYIIIVAISTGVVVCAAVIVATLIWWRKSNKREYDETGLSEILLSPASNWDAPTPTLTSPPMPSPASPPASSPWLDTLEVTATTKPSTLEATKRTKLPIIDGTARTRSPTLEAAQTTSLESVDSKLEEFPEDILGFDTIQKGAPLARGGMSTVFNGKYGVIPVALKEALGSLDTLLNEAATIMKLRHPNVVHVYGIWKDREHRVFMVFLGFWLTYFIIRATLVFAFVLVAVVFSVSLILAVAWYLHLGFGFLRESRHFVAHQETVCRGLCPATATMGLAGRHLNVLPRCDASPTLTRTQTCVY